MFFGDMYGGGGQPLKALKALNIETFKSFFFCYVCWGPLGNL